MFEFSKEFDEDLDDFLSIPLDNVRGKEETNPIRRESVSNGQMNSSTTKDEFVFDNFGEDEEVLSFVENIDSTYSQCIQNSSLNTSNLELVNRTPSTESSAVAPKKKHVQEQLDSFVQRKPAPSKRPNKFVTVTDESPSPLKLKYEREFPGPAGLRLKRSRDSLPNEELNDSGFKQQLNASFVNDTLSENMNWVEMMKDINAQSCELSKVMNEFTVISLKKLGNVARKVPLFAAVIFNVNASTSEPSAMLKDPTGVIRASFDEDLWAQYSHLLTVGSALLLRKVGMLSRSRRLSLLVTTHNVDTIYSLKLGDESSVLITRVTPSTILDALHERESNLVKTVIKSPNAASVPKLNNVTAPLSVKSSSNTSYTVPVAANLDNIVSSTKGSTDSHKENSVPSFPPSIDNEFEGIDLDSLLGDF